MVAIGWVSQHTTLCTTVKIGCYKMQGKGNDISQATLGCQVKYVVL